MMRLVIIWTIRGYQKMISRYTPPVCRFYPSCSKYTLQAVNEHGIAKGVFMGTWRILRCNPLFSGGYDPVPKRNGGKSNE